MLENGVVAKHLIIAWQSPEGGLNTARGDPIERNLGKVRFHQQIHLESVNNIKNKTNRIQWLLALRK